MILIEVIIFVQTQGDWPSSYACTITISPRISHQNFVLSKMSVKKEKVSLATWIRIHSLLHRSPKIYQPGYGLKLGSVVYKCVYFQILGTVITLKKYKSKTHI